MVYLKFRRGPAIFFLYPIHFFIYNGGIFQDSTRDGFYFYINTSINIYPGGLLITKSPSYIHSYIQRNATISQIALNDSKISGPYTIVINDNGAININGSSSTSTSTIITSTNIGAPFTLSSYLTFLTVLIYIITFIHKN